MISFQACATCGSSTKFFGPHAGVLYGKYDLLNELKAYKVRPASNKLPYKFETGTQNHEEIAGVLGALEYFEWLGNRFGSDQTQAWKDAGYSGRRLAFKQAASVIREYEHGLSRALIHTVQSVPGTGIHGVTDMDRLDERVPTVSFTVEGRDPEHIADAIGKQGIITHWRSWNEWACSKRVAWSVWDPFITTLSRRLRSLGKY